MYELAEGESTTNSPTAAISVDVATALSADQARDQHLWKRFAESWQNIYKENKLYDLEFKSQLLGECNISVLLLLLLLLLLLMLLLLLLQLLLLLSVLCCQLSMHNAQDR